MIAIAREDIECDDLVVVSLVNDGRMYARKAVLSERANAVAMTFIGQDDLCCWDPLKGSLINGSHHD